MIGRTNINVGEAGRTIIKLGEADRINVGAWIHPFTRERGHTPRFKDPVKVIPRN
jgi:hypothetical protein